MKKGDSAYIHSWFKLVWDYLVVIFGITTLILSFACPESKLSALCSLLAGGLGFIYAIFAVFLCLGSRARFDWHLVNGNYILKVVAVAVLTPFSLSILVSNSPNSLQAEDLVFDCNLYQQQQPSDSLLIESEDSFKVVLPLYKSRVQNAYTFSTSNLPESVSARQTNPPLFWTVYYHFIDPGNQHMTTSKEGRCWAAIIAILGVFLLNGLLISAIIGWIDSRKERWHKGDIRYNGLLHCREHYIIVGANDMIGGVVKYLLNNDQSCLNVLNPYILIQTSRDVESFRRELFSGLTPSQQRRIIVYYGDRNSTVDIHDLGLNKAIEVYVLGEDARVDDVESYHDTMNMQCLKLISNEIADIKKFKKGNDIDERLVCRVMFEYQTSFNLFQVIDIDDKKIKFLPFNYYEKWAQNVLICQELDNEENCKYLPLEGFEGIKSHDDTYVHLVIVGMSRMGVAMAIEAAHLAHYPNFEEKQRRTKITFIDKNASEEKEFFMGRFKELFSLSHWCYGNVIDDTLVWEKVNELCPKWHLGGDFLDVEWEFINASIETPAAQKYMSDASLDENVKLTIAICFPENNRAIAAATYLPDSVYQSKNTLQVLVYQRLNDELVRQISDNPRSRYSKKIKAFGMAKDCYDSKLVDIAEYIEKPIGDAYDKYAWSMMLRRFMENGLTEEDYDNLTAGIYAKLKDNMQSNLRKLCDDWVREQLTNDYSIVKGARKSFREQLVKLYPQVEKLEKKGGEGKSISAKMWSNHYNIYSMWTKYRCVTTADGHVFNPLNESFDGIDSLMMSELGQMEHNRWVVEQLLLRYRPLTKDEQDAAKLDTLYSSPVQKNIYKSQYAHLDICSNTRLNEIDYNISLLDKTLIAELPSAYKNYLENKDR